MTEQLKEALQEGEQLLWQGKAESFETLDRTHKQNLIMTTVISLGVALAICIAYIAPMLVPITTSGRHSSQ